MINFKTTSNKNFSVKTKQRSLMFQNCPIFRNDENQIRSTNVLLSVFKTKTSKISEQQKMSDMAKITKEILTHCYITTKQQSILFCNEFLSEYNEDRQFVFNSSLQKLIKI